MVTNSSDEQSPRQPAAKRFQCSVCGLGYVHRSGLSRHLNRTACGTIEAAGPQASASTGGDLERQNDELRGMVKELVAGMGKDAAAREDMVGQLREQSEIIKEMIPRIGNNNNNQFNINVFLNDRCRDAINMTDFIESLQVQLQDLKFTGARGLIEGVSSVLVQGLRRLSTCQRPIHCMDTQQEVMYIKDNDAWNAQTPREGLRTAIADVANKQRKAISDWEAHNPDWDKSDEGRAQYLGLVRSVMADVTGDQSHREIARQIAKETTVDFDRLGPPT